MTADKTDDHQARSASLLAFLGGLWLFLSPWIYGASGNSNAWNSWIIGAVICFLALMRGSRPAAINLSWLNSILGLWTFLSPWIFAYTGSSGRMINSLCVGFLVFCSAIIGANSARMSHHTTSTS